MQFDYDAHNAEVKEVWDAYRKRDPIRVPCNIAMNIRMILRRNATKTCWCLFRIERRWRKL